MQVIEKYLSLIFIIGFTTFSQAQEKELPAKVSHAEPLYSDLVRDLGARRGEKEWNVGTEYSTTRHYNENGFLVEYEFAPFNRLGMEIEADFAFYKNKVAEHSAPGNELECLRFSTQYSFFVSPKFQTTLAVGYTQIIDFTEFKNYGKEDLVTGTIYNPFFIAAKRWGNHLNTLIYLSPMMEHDFVKKSTTFLGQINTSVLYTFSGIVRFVGVEFNKEIRDNKFKMMIRPQIKFKINQKLAAGLVTGFPAQRSPEHFNTFIRLIYEP